MIEVSTRAQYKLISSEACLVMSLLNILSWNEVRSNSTNPSGRRRCQTTEQIFHHTPTLAEAERLLTTITESLAHVAAVSNGYHDILTLLHASTDLQ